MVSRRVARAMTRVAVPAAVETLDDSGARYRTLGCALCGGFIAAHMEGPLFGHGMGWRYVTTILEEHLVEEPTRRDGLRVFGLPTDLRPSASPGWTERIKTSRPSFDRGFRQPRPFPMTVARAPFFIHCPARGPRGTCGTLNLVRAWDAKAWNGIDISVSLTVTRADGSVVR